MTECHQMNETTVFQARKGDDNDVADIWDDTALIKAYDKAIKIIRGGGSNEESGDPEKNRKFSRSAGRRKKKRQGNQKKAKRKRVWKVGDRCRAVYTEDEYIYDAVIKLIDHHRATCWVTFMGYGNEEEKDLDDLMSAGSEAASPTRPVNGDFEAGYESAEYPNHIQSPAPSGSEIRGHNYDLYHHDNTWGTPHQPVFAPMPPPLMNWPPHGFAAPGFAPYPHFPGLGMPMPPVTTPIPPPPPMPAPPALQEGDDEALHAMLMSWYMSGYHTGYYQGLKQGRSSNQNASSGSQDNLRKRTRRGQQRPRRNRSQSR